MWTVWSSTTRAEDMHEIGADAFLVQPADPRHEAIATVIYRLESLSWSLRGSTRATELANVQDVLREALDLLRPLSDTEEANAPQDAAQLAAWQVSVLKVFIIRHLPDRIKLEDLAVAAGLSTCQFGRLFLRSFGMPPMRFLKLVRIEQAKRLLEQTRLPCREVAERCGFPGEDYFKRIFHRETGMTPRRWRICEKA